MADAGTSPGRGRAAVGARVRSLRVERGLSLSLLAARAGIGKGSLSELEAGRRNPTLDTLYAVARPLGVPLAALLEDEDGALVADPGVVARRLRVREEPEGTVEVYLLTLDPGAVRSSPAHTAGVEEQVVVLGGRLELDCAGGAVVLGVGEHHRFAADRPHRYRVMGDRGCEALDVIITPRGATESRGGSVRSG
jgi:transcriptional regulator with XRE-family HTH domain